MKTNRVFIVLVCLLALIVLLACESEEKRNAQATEIAASIFATQTAQAPTVTPTGTATATPTETPIPTSTATPTPTPTATHTATPEPTHTATPEPTHTATPEPTYTATPEATATATSTPLPPPTATPTITPTPTATLEPVTLWYRSNPNDVLGTFPAYYFDAQALYKNMVKLQEALPVLQGALSGALNGDAGACQSYIDAYDAIMNSGVFYEDVPGDWEDIDLRYVLSFIYSLDRTRPAYLSCKNSGKVDQFNHNLAWQAIDLTNQVLGPGITAAKAKLGIK